MQFEEVITKLVDAAEERGFRAVPSGDDGNDGVSTSSLLGIFQLFRPDGISDLGIFSKTPGGQDFEDRLRGIYNSVGHGNRSDGLKDAYFVVRNPPAIGEQAAQEIAETFVRSCLKFNALTDGSFDTVPQVRILEGKPPKHPKAVAEQASLLRLLLHELPASIATRLNESALAANLEEPLYFIACDRWLRDYLRWPLAEAAPEPNLSDEATSALMTALDSYFELWKHGIKFRIFSDREVDFYLPRRIDGTLIDAGQFATKHSDRE